MQVVRDGQLKTEVQLKSSLSVLAGLSELTSTAAELDQLDSSFEHPPLHHNYYIQSGSCVVAGPSRGFNCRAWSILMKFLQKGVTGQRL